MATLAKKGNHGGPVRLTEGLTEAQLAQMVDDITVRRVLLPDAAKKYGFCSAVISLYLKKLGWKYEYGRHRGWRREEAVR